MVNQQDDEVEAFLAEIGTNTYWQQRRNDLRRKEEQLNDGINLYSVFIYFGTRFHSQFLRDYTSRNIATDLRPDSIRARLVKAEIRGRYRASHFLTLCKRKRIDPRDVFSEIQPEVFLSASNRYRVADREFSDEVIQKICEEYDNRS